MDNRASEAIRSGAAVVTAGRRLARHLRGEYDLIQRSEGLLAWPAPNIVSWTGWLDSLWEQIIFQYPEALVRLSEWQERVVWERVIDEAGEAAQLLQKRATALAAREAWHLATAWRIYAESIQGAGGEDAHAFAGWVRAFRKRCSSQGWLDEAGLDPRARGTLAHFALEEAWRELRTHDRLCPPGFGWFDSRLGSAGNRTLD